MAITEKDFEQFQWDNITIQTHPSGKNILVLICNTQAGSERLMELLQSSPYKLGILKETDGNYTFLVEIEDSEQGIKLATARNEKNYPSLKTLQKNPVAFLTTGFWAGRSEKGRHFEYNRQYLRLGGDLNMGEALAHAKEVQFITQNEGKSPSLVALMFESWEHIHRAEAMEAYEDLIERSKSKPHLEIKKEGVTVTLKIWDILVDLDVTMSGLQYSDDQLKDFLKYTDTNYSFVFAVGFLPPDDAEAGIALAAPHITLYGYVYKDSTAVR